MLVRDQSQFETLAGMLTEQRTAGARQGVPNARERRLHLRRLERLVKGNAHAFARAISADFGRRSVHETRLTEIFPLVEAARYARRRVARWMAPERRSIPPYLWPARAHVVWQPLGIVGIVAPWNYPLLLALGPLVGALAAGNRAMIKVSEHTPHTGQLLERLAGDEFATDRVRIINGGVAVAKRFSALPFDHLLFTGSTESGRSVMRAAAHNLTPLTLELGGKSPAIVGADASIPTAAARILSGKLRNAGQTCIAPDYALIPEGSIERFVRAARVISAARYPDPAGNADYTSIINDAQFARLAGLLADARAKGAIVVPLVTPAPGAAEAGARIVLPTLVHGVTERMRIVHEEIFGPILPLVAYSTLAEALAYVNARPNPLALYYFGHAARDIDTVVNSTHSGGVCINDVTLHFAPNSLPFGGVGASGFGEYHGRAGFERFSHERAVFEQARLSGTALLEPPYGKRFEAVLRLLQR